jgi:hypothetical protein
MIIAEQLKNTSERSKSVPGYKIQTTLHYTTEAFICSESNDIDHIDEEVHTFLHGSILLNWTMKQFSTCMIRKERKLNNSMSEITFHYKALTTLYISTSK